MLLQMYLVLLLPKTQPTQDQLSTKALQLQASGGNTSYYRFILFLLPKTQPTQDRLPTETATTPHRGPYVTRGVAESVLRRTL